MSTVGFKFKKQNDSITIKLCFIERMYFILINVHNHNINKLPVYYNIMSILLTKPQIMSVKKITLPSELTKYNFTSLLGFAYIEFVSSVSYVKLMRKHTVSQW